MPEELLRIICMECEQEFFAYDDSPEQCPFCGSDNIKYDYDTRFFLCSGSEIEQLKECDEGWAEEE